MSKSPIVTVDISTMFCPSPADHPRYLAIPKRDNRDGEIGLFILICRTKSMHGIFHLYLGGFPTADDAQLFVGTNPEVFPGQDWVIVEAEHMPSVDTAIKHAEGITQPNGVVDPRNVYFLGNWRLSH